MVPATRLDGRQQVGEDGVEPNDMFDDYVDELDAPRSAPPPVGIAAGMALCIPALSVLGLLYTLLK